MNYDITLLIKVHPSTEINNGRGIDPVIHDIIKIENSSLDRDATGSCDIDCT